MGGVKSLLFGPTWEDVDVLNQTYGAHPSQLITLPNGETIHLRDEGKKGAFPLVLVHGHSEDLHTWNGLVERLVEEFRVIRYDLRRHGLTGPASDDGYSIERYVADLAMVVDHLGLERFDLVGHSMGGRISVRYAMDHQDRVSRLILLSASGPPRKQDTKQPLALRLMKNPLGRFMIKRIWSRNMAKKSLEDMVFDPSIVTDEDIDRMWAFSRYPGSMEAMFREFADSWPEFTSDEIQGIRTHALLIWGEEDSICPVELAEFYHAHLQHADMVVVPKVGHCPQVECPERCVAEMLRWMGTA